MPDFQQQIVKLLPVPAVTFCTRGDWSALETRLKTPLPADYKWFVSTYGGGGIGTKGSTEPYMDCPSPFCSADDGGLDGFQNVALWNMASYIADFYTGRRTPIPILWPQPGGLLPFANLRNCKYLSWRTVGPPDEWSLNVWDDDDLTFQDFPAGNTFRRFLVDMLERREVLLNGASLTGAGWLDEPAFLPYDPK